MEKAKRKEQYYNARRYWLFFSVLAVLLLIPFRIVGYWILTDFIYIVISVLLMIAVIRFVRRYSWRKWIVGLMLICVMLPILQITQNPAQDDCYIFHDAIVNQVYCNHVCTIAGSHFLVLKNTSIGVQIGKNVFAGGVYCLF